MKFNLFFLLLFLFKNTYEEKKIIDVHHIVQTEKYPTGCESISTMMNLNYTGIEITPEEMTKYGITEEGENHEIQDYWQKVIMNSRYFTINDKDKTIIKNLYKPINKEETST